MPFDRALHHDAARRRRQPVFAALSRGLAASLSVDSLQPLSAALRAGASVEDLLFAASIHGVAGLAARLCERQPGILSAEAEERLHAARALAAERASRFADDIARLGCRASGAGLRLIPLKGAVLGPLFYRDTSLRPLSDLDLLAPGPDFDAWTRVLLEAGYAVEKETFKNRVFVQAGSRTTGSGFVEDPENPRPVELHGRVRERFLGRVVDITDALVGGLAPARLHGADAWVPAGSAMALHLFTHLAPEAVGRGARLVQIHDFRFLDSGEETVAVLHAALGDAAWGLAALFEREVPGVFPEPLARALLADPPPLSRRRRWLARPGLLTGEEDRTLLALAELPLCASPRAAMGRILQAVPERDVLDTVYGARTRGEWAMALFRWYRDRLR